MSDGWRIGNIELKLWRYELETAVGGSGVRFVDLVVASIGDGEGGEGLGFSYVLGASGKVPFVAAGELAEQLRGSEVQSPATVWDRLVKGLNRLGKGPAFIGLAALDVALWDLHAKRARLPLGRLLGGTVRPVPVYGSGFFHAAQTPAEAVASTERYLAAGVGAVKPRVSGRASDAAVIGAVARVLPPEVRLMLDANEKCDLASALWLCGVAAAHGALFVEEPLPSDAAAAYRALAARSPAAIALGEHLQGNAEFAHFLAGDGIAVLQPDLAMAGGITGCLRVAQLAEAAGRSVAPHFLPDLFVHLTGVAANLSWLEHFPLLEPLFQNTHGVDRIPTTLQIPDRPGHGLAWAEDISRRVRVLA